MYLHMSHQRTGRHAYCIIAHNDRHCLETLLEMTDDSRNDIYLLPDRKSPPSLTEGLRCSRARLNVIPKEKRVDIRWGGNSQIKAELTLMEAVVETGGYDFVHLLSGVDLPLKTQDEIHAFFDNAPKGANFIELDEGENIDRHLNNVTSRYYPFIEHQRKVGSGVAATVRLMTARLARHAFLGLQKAVGYKRDWHGLRLGKGLNWASMSEDFCRYLVEQRRFILKRFRGVPCADEIYKQTMALNSRFDATIHAYSRGNSEGIRLMDWKRGNIKAGNPYVWRMEDWEELDTAFEPFARKFSSSEDKAVIDRLKMKILGPAD